MKSFQVALIAAAAIAAFATASVQAAPVVATNGALSGPVFTFDSLSGPGFTLTNNLTTLNDGSTARPQGASGSYFTVFGGGTGTVSFSAGVSAVSFLWGSPDTYNNLSFGTTGGSFNFGHIGGTGNNADSRYVTFSATGGDLITSMTLTSSSNSFEIDNMAITAAVPEPQTYALLLGGIAAVGFVARRRKPQDTRG